MRKILGKILGGMAATIAAIATVLFWSAVKAVLLETEAGNMALFVAIVSIPALILIYGVLASKRARAAELAAQQQEQWPPLPEYQVLPQGQQWPPTQQEQWPQ